MPLEQNSSYDTSPSGISKGTGSNGISGGTNQTAISEPNNQAAGADSFNSALMKEDQSSTASEDNTPTGLSDPNLWGAASQSLSKNGMVEFSEGDAQVMIMKDDTRLVPVVRNEEEMFTTTAVNAAQANDLEAVVNAHQYEMTFCAYVDLAIGGDAVDPELIVPQGQTVENGNVIAGRTSPQTFYVAQTVEESGRIENSFGFGDPPENSTVAFGGGFPMIIDGLKYNEENVYAPGTSDEAPLSGDPGKYENQLQMRSNNGYATFVREYERASGNFSTGKVIVAHSSANEALAVVVQPNGAEIGVSLSDLRDSLSDAGFDNAIVYDGSTSATLVRDGQVEFEPSNNKNKTINTGIGFDIDDGQLGVESSEDKKETMNIGT